MRGWISGRSDAVSGDGRRSSLWTCGDSRQRPSAERSLAGFDFESRAAGGRRCEQRLYDEFDQGSTFFSRLSGSEMWTGAPPDWRRCSPRRAGDGGQQFFWIIDPGADSRGDRNVHFQRRAESGRRRYHAGQAAQVGGDAALAHAQDYRHRRAGGDTSGRRSSRTQYRCQKRNWSRDNGIRRRREIRHPQHDRLKCLPDGHLPSA